LWLPVIHFSSNPKFIEDLQLYLINTTDVYMGIAKQSENTHVLYSHSWKKSIDILDYMYRQSTIYLERKFAKVKEIKEAYRDYVQRPYKIHYPKDYLLDLKARFKTWISVADHLGIKATALHYHLRKVNIYQKDFQPKAGETYGRLTILEIFSDKRNSEKYNCLRARCICECGNEAVTRLQNLRDGTTRSCGCLFLEVAAEKGRKTAKNRKDNTWIEFNGKRMIAADWIRELNIPSTTFHRLYRKYKDIGRVENVYEKVKCSR